MRILLLGASGLVGSESLRLALDHREVDIVIAPTRAPLPSHKKLTNPVSTKLETLLPAAARWSVDAVVCALGTTIAKAGSRDSFYRIDHDLPLAFARLAHGLGSQTFALVSAIGASPYSRFFYARTKGELESDLGNIGFESLAILRPVIIEGEREEFRLAESVVLRFAQVLRPILPRRFRANPASTIAQVLVDAAVHPRRGIRFIFSPELTATN